MIPAPALTAVSIAAEMAAWPVMPFGWTVAAVLTPLVWLVATLVRLGEQPC